MQEHSPRAVDGANVRRSDARNLQTLTLLSKRETREARQSATAVYLTNALAVLDAVALEPDVLKRAILVNVSQRMIRHVVDMQLTRWEVTPSGRRAAKAVTP